jgi:hypothetical protein
MSLHEEAAAKKQKHAIATTATQAAQVKKTAAQAEKGMDRPQVRVRKDETAQVVTSYKKGAVREEKQKLSVLEERERLEQAMIDTETRKKKASLAHIAAVKQQIERLESQKEHAQHEKLERQKEAAQHAAERAHQAKKRSKTVRSLELEMAAIKNAENARLAALSAKIKSLGVNGDTPGGVAEPERAHTPKEKAAVKVLSAPRNQKLAAKPLVASSVADSAPIKEALSKLAQDEKTTDCILAPKSAAKLSTLTSRNSPSPLTQRARSSWSGVWVWVCDAEGHAGARLLSRERAPPPVCRAPRQEAVAVPLFREPSKEACLGTFAPYSVRRDGCAGMGARDPRRHARPASAGVRIHVESLSRSIFVHMLIMRTPVCVLSSLYAFVCCVTCACVYVLCRGTRQEHRQCESAEGRVNSQALVWFCHGTRQRETKHAQGRRRPESDHTLPPGKTDIPLRERLPCYRRCRRMLRARSFMDGLRRSKYERKLTSKMGAGGRDEMGKLV